MMLKENDNFTEIPEEPIRTKTIGRGRAQRIHNNKRKALRKRKIAKSIYSSSDPNWEYYSNLNEYSKNKIHCSCPLCTQKTNGKMSKSRGAVSCLEVMTEFGTLYHYVRGSRIPTTNQRFGKKHWSISDRKKIESMESTRFEQNAAEEVTDAHD